MLCLLCTCWYQPVKEVFAAVRVGKIKDNMALFYITFYRADFDSMYYCKLLGVCVTTENGDAQITDAFVNPISGRQGIYQLQ